MITAAIPSNESARLEVLHRYDILDTGPEHEFDEITRLASYICGTPISMMTLVDADRQWFKSKVGLDIDQTPRDQAFCAHTILQNDALVINDTLEDARFADNPLVRSAPHIRFYAGIPLLTPDGHALGSLCAIDRVPRELSLQQLNALDTLARQVVRNMELRSACLREHDRAALLDRLNSRKNRLFKLVSHDLKSPFSGVLGMLEYLIEHQASMSPAEIREDLLALLASAGETFKLLERLLQWSTFDSGEMPYRPQRLDVNELMEGVVILLRGVARRKGIELRVLPGAELAVLADLTMTHSVVQNLVGNALKFTPSGGTITLAATRQDDWVEISVRDSGVGLSSERIRQIMNRESAGLPANSTLGTAGEAGTGLGIDLCRGFVDKHGGHFAVDSTPGEGACFRFTLPRAD